MDPTPTPTPTPNSPLPSAAPDTTPAISSAPIAPVPTPAPASNKMVLGIISLIAGILAFLTGFFFVGIIFGVVAAAFGILSLKKQPAGKGLAITGLIIGGIGLVSGVIFTIIPVTDVLHNVFHSKTALYNPEDQVLLDSKKDFAKGETARFAYLDVKITDSVVATTDQFKAAKKEYVALAVTVTNPTKDSQKTVGPDLKANVDGTVIDCNPDETGQLSNVDDIQPGESIKGQMYCIIPDTAKVIKIQYTKENVGGSQSSSGKRLVWKLAI